MALSSFGRLAASSAGSGKREASFFLLSFFRGMSVADLSSLLTSVVSFSCLARGASSSALMSLSVLVSPEERSLLSPTLTQKG